MRIAFISEHASPLATIGGVHAGGQNVYVAELSKYLSNETFEIDVFTRWDNPNIPRIVPWLPGVRIIHIKAGGINVLPKEELLQHSLDMSRNYGKVIYICCSSFDGIYY